MILSRPRQRLACPILALLAVLVIVRPAAADTDPFYQDLLTEGRAALDRGDLETALLDLEIASFGLLDNPPQLADGLVYLALAQAEADRIRELDTTLERLIEVETRFRGYRDAEIPDTERQRFEELLLERVSLDRLRRIEAFRPIAERRDLESLMSMRPGERRQALERRLRADPSDIRSLQLLAELELDEGNPRAALEYANRLIEMGGGDPLLVCLRFRAAALAGDCAVALEDLPSCTEEARQLAVAEPILECLAGDEGPQPALEFLDTLPPEVRHSSKLRKAERQLERQLKEQERLARQRPQPEAEESMPEATGEESAGEAEPAAEEPAISGRAAAATADAGEAPTEEAPAPTAATEGPSTPADVDPCAELRRDALAKRCAAALAAIGSCPEVEQEAKVAERLAVCLTDAERWSDVRAFIETLPPQVRGRPKLRKLDRRAAEREPEVAAAADEAETDEAGTPAAAAATPAPGEGEAGMPPAMEAASEEPDEAVLEATRRQLLDARSSQTLDRALAEAIRLARRYPSSKESQLLAAEAAYRAARWQEAVHFFETAGELGNDQPLLLFYRAVSLYEVGRVAAAAADLDRALPKLRRTPFVENYVEKIRRAAER